MNRYFAPTASWNTPAAQFGKADASYSGYVARLLTYGGGLDPKAQRITTYFRDYSIPVVYASEATTTARVYQSSTMAGRLTLGCQPGESIPWNPAWLPGPGNDASLLIVDEKTGRVWEPWMLDRAPAVFNYLTWPNLFAGILNPGGTKLGVGSCQTYSGLTTATDDGVVWNRGCGLHKLAMIVRAEEVSAGRIDHALPLMIAMSMWGPLASPPIGNTGPGAGFSKGFYCRPATRLEHADPQHMAAGGVSTFPLTDPNRAKSIPSGMRFALKISDAEINAWLDSRSYAGALRNTARIFAVALRDYGMIVAETGGYGMGIETEGLVNSLARYQWAQLGVLDDGTAYPRGDLLLGLVTERNLYVVRPPA